MIVLTAVPSQSKRATTTGTTVADEEHDNSKQGLKAMLRPYMDMYTILHVVKDYQRKAA